METYTFHYQVETDFSPVNHTLSWRFADPDGKSLDLESLQQALEIYAITLAELPNAQWSDTAMSYGFNAYDTKMEHPLCRITSKKPGTEHPHACWFGNPEILRRWQNGERKSLSSKSYTNPKYVSHQEFHMLRMAQTAYRIQDQELKSQQRGKIRFPELTHLKNMIESDPQEWNPRYALEYSIYEFSALESAHWQVTGRDHEALPVSQDSWRAKQILLSMMACITKEDSSHHPAYQVEIVYPDILESRTSFKRFIDQRKDIPAMQFRAHNRLEFDYDARKSLVYWRYVTPNRKLLKTRQVPRAMREFPTLLKYILAKTRMDSNSNRLLRGSVGNPELGS